MATRWGGWYWNLGVALLAMGGVIATSGDSALAQIKPDGTLGSENSTVKSIGSVDQIDGGATRGSNLFHSFEQFSVLTGREAYFNNAPNIQNIISRVTGLSISNIDGLIRANGTANLFLLNPNGIIFGPNAQLDIRGSFIGTTANAFQFGQQGNFSATNPAAPPLLTVNPSALLFNQLNPGAITNRARPLSTQQGSLFLVGGNITFDGGGAVVVGNRIELGGLAGAGAVGLTGSGNELRLNFPVGVPRADVVLQNNAAAFATNGGAIAVEAGNLNVFGESYISTNLRAGEGSPGSRAGDVVINATGAVTVDGNSSINSTSYENSLGDSGNITIDAQAIRLNNTSLIYTRSEKNRGSIRLNATEDVTLDGGSGINTFGRPTSIGNSGDITVKTRNINLSNSSTINSGNIGKGRGGRTTLQATDAIALASGSDINSDSIPEESGVINSEPSGDIEIAARSLFLDGQNTSISSNNLSEGRAGDIRITTNDKISLNEFAFIIASTSGQGDAGYIQLTTRSLTLSNGSGISSQTRGAGNSGTLLVNASDSVTLSGTAVFINPLNGESTIAGSSLSTSAQGSGNSGQITINTGRLSIQDGGYLLTGKNSNSSGSGGDLTIKASDSVEIVGTDPNGGFSKIDTSNLGNGDAGDVTINTGRLSIRDGALVGTASLRGSTGQGGDLTINASDSIEIIGASPVNYFNSELITLSGGSGNAGRISIDTRRLSLGNGAAINASTVGSGRGGDININASDSVQIEANPADTDKADGIFTSTVGSGNAGNLSLRTQRLSVRNGGAVSAAAGLGSTGRGGNVTINASDLVEVVGISNDGRLASLLSVRSQGEGAAGDITVNSPRISIQDRGTVTAESNTVDGGNINLNADNLLLRRNSNISTTAGNAGAGGNGGNITITAPFIITIPSENSDITANAFTGRGGRVQIKAQGIFGTQFRPQLTPLSDITASSTFGVRGTVEINTPDVDPSRGLVTLPTELVDASRLIATGCGAGGRQGESKFIITGRGGLPLRPGDGNISHYPTGTVRSIPSSISSIEPTISFKDSDPASNPTRVTAPAPLVEATGWVINDKGEVVLTAHAPNITPNPWLTPATCHSSTHTLPLALSKR